MLCHKLAGDPWTAVPLTSSQGHQVETGSAEQGAPETYSGPLVP